MLPKYLIPVAVGLMLLQNSSVIMPHYDGPLPRVVSKVSSIEIYSQPHLLAAVPASVNGELII